MVSNSQKIRVILFLIFSGIVLAAFLFAILGPTLLKEYDYYYIEYQDQSVGGLEVGAVVKYHGVKIGRVEDVYIHPENVTKVMVKLAVKENTPIKRDALAVVENLGITGLKYINITGGSMLVENLASGSKIASGISTVENISGKADVILQKVEIVLNNLLTITNPNIEKNILNNTNFLISQANHFFSQNQESIKKFVQHLPSLTIHLDTSLIKLDKLLLASNQIVENKEIFRMLDNMQKGSSIFLKKMEEVDNTQLVADLSSLIRNSNNAIGHFDQTLLYSRDNLLKALENLETTLDHLAEFTKVISEKPSLLIRGRSEDVR